jgi:hypothetical protein
MMVERCDNGLKLVIFNCSPGIIFLRSYVHSLDK